MQRVIERHRSESHGEPSLFVITGQSNVTGIRPNLSILNDAKKAGFSTLIDAAALASSTRVSLQQNPAADAMAVSFYKIFGYPTGVGALIAKKSFLSTLTRTWFSGGTVDFVQVPGTLTLHAQDLNTRFEVRLNLYSFDSLSNLEIGRNAQLFLLICHRSWTQVYRHIYALHVASPSYSSSLSS